MDTIMVGRRVGKEGGYRSRRILETFLPSSDPWNRASMVPSTSMSNSSVAAGSAESLGAPTSEHEDNSDKPPLYEDRSALSAKEACSPALVLPRNAEGEQP